MTKPLIPPNGLFVSSQVLFHPTMTAALKDTLIQMMALTWGDKSRMTPVLTYALLEQLTGKSVRRLYGQFTVLRKTYSAFKLQNAGNGTFVLTLAEWLFSPPQEGYSFKQIAIKEEEEESIHSARTELTPPPDINIKEEEYEGEPEKIAKFSKRKPLSKPMRVLPADLREKLLAAGVFPDLLDEVAVSSYSVDELRALLAWVMDGKAASPGGAFIARLRKHQTPPEAYRHSPCPYCGLRGGKHAADCRGRYLTGEYADFVEH
jgi:hypothetical protein